MFQFLWRCLISINAIWHLCVSLWKWFYSRSLPCDYSPQKQIGKLWTDHEYIQILSLMKIGIGGLKVALVGFFLLDLFHFVSLHKISISNLYIDLNKWVFKKRCYWLNNILNNLSHLKSASDSQFLKVIADWGKP